MEESVKLCQDANGIAWITHKIVDGEVYDSFTVGLTVGDATITARYIAQMAGNLDDWCPGSPSEIDLRVTGTGITSYVWQQGGLLPEVGRKWDAVHRDVAEALLRTRLAERIAAMGVKPATRGRVEEPYYAALLAMFEYAEKRCDYPHALIAEVYRLSPSMLRTRLDRARALELATLRAAS